MKKEFDGKESPVYRGLEIVMATSDEANTLQALLNRHAKGDATAAEELISYAMDRLRRLARKLLRDDPRVHRWEATDDVLQNALVRFYRALKATKPAAERDFINLAATQIRRELTDLARHHFGPEGHAANVISDPQPLDGDGNRRPNIDQAADGKTGPATAMRQTEFHAYASQLPDEEREVFDLIFYLGLEQAEVAKRLGISVPTVKRRWRSARLLMAEALGSDAELT